jgi:hypothetical protein
MLQRALILAVLGIAAACDGPASNSTKAPGEPPIPVGAIMADYKKDKAATIAKYNGKTLKVGGYPTTAPIMPTTATDDGILIIQEKGGDTLSTMTCWFKQADQADFKDIRANEPVILTGVFEDTISTGLRGCKVVK